jgi:hypothetical protein
LISFINLYPVNNLTVRESFLKSWKAFLCDSFVPGENAKHGHSPESRDDWRIIRDIAIANDTGLKRHRCCQHQRLLSAPRPANYPHSVGQYIDATTKPPDGGRQARQGRLIRENLHPAWCFCG